VAVVHPRREHRRADAAARSRRSWSDISAISGLTTTTAGGGHAPVASAGS